MPGDDLSDEHKNIKQWVADINKQNGPQSLPTRPTTAKEIADHLPTILMNVYNLNERLHKQLYSHDEQDVQSYFIQDKLKKEVNEIVETLLGSVYAERINRLIGWLNETKLWVDVEPKVSESKVIPKDHYLKNCSSAWSTMDDIEGNTPAERTSSFLEKHRIRFFDVSDHLIKKRNNDAMKTLTPPINKRWGVGGFMLIATIVAVTGYYNLLKVVYSDERSWCRRQRMVNITYTFFHESFGGCVTAPGKDDKKNTQTSDQTKMPRIMRAMKFPTTVSEIVLYWFDENVTLEVIEFMRVKDDSIKLTTRFKLWKEIVLVAKLYGVGAVRTIVATLLTVLVPVLFGVVSFIIGPWIAMKKFLDIFVNVGQSDKKWDEPIEKYQMQVNTHTRYAEHHALNRMLLLMKEETKDGGDTVDYAKITKRLSKEDGPWHFDQSDDVDSNELFWDGIWRIACDATQTAVVEPDGDGNDPYKFASSDLLKFAKDDASDRLILVKELEDAAQKQPMVDVPKPGYNVCDQLEKLRQWREFWECVTPPVNPVCAENQFPELFTVPVPCDERKKNDKTHVEGPDGKKKLIDGLYYMDNEQQSFFKLDDPTNLMMNENSTLYNCPNLVKFIVYLLRWFGWAAWTFPPAAALSSIIAVPCALIQAAMVSFNMQMDVTLSESSSEAFKLMLKSGLKYGAAVTVLSLALMIILSKTEVEAVEEIQKYIKNHPKRGVHDYNRAKYNNPKTPFVWMAPLFMLMFVASTIGPIVLNADMSIFDWLIKAWQWLKRIFPSFELPPLSISPAHVIVMVTVAVICTVWAITYDAEYNVASGMD